MNITIIAALISAAAAAAVTWNLQAHQITKLELTHANERIAAARTNRQTLERVMGQNATAQANATASAIRLRANRDAAANAGNGLRIAASSAVRAAVTDPTLCSDTAATLAELLDSVSTERRTLSEKADRHVIDIEALMTRQR